MILVDVVAPADREDRSLHWHEDKATRPYYALLQRGASMDPRISVVIPSQGKPWYLRAVLHALQRSGGGNNDLDVEVIVIVDPRDTARPSYAEVFRELAWPWLKVVWHEDANRSSKRNAGLARSTGDVVLLLDDDCLPESGLLAAHARSHETDAQHFAVSHAFDLSPVATEAVLSADAASVPNRGAAPRLSRMARATEEAWGSGVHRSPFPAWTLFVTRCVSLRRENLLAFDEGFRGWGVEDWEYGRRLLDGGIGAQVLPGPSVLHLAHPTGPGQSRDLIRNLQRFLQLHPSPDVSLGVRFDPRSLQLGPESVLRWGDISFKDFCRKLEGYDSCTGLRQLFHRRLWFYQAQVYLGLRSWLELATDAP